MQTVTTSKEEPSAWSYPGLWVGIFGLILIIIAIIILLFNWNTTGVGNNFLTDSWWIWILLAFGFILMIGGFIWYAFSGPDTTAEIKTTVATTTTAPVVPQNSDLPYGTLINQIPLVPDQYRAPDGTIYRRESAVNVASPNKFNLVAVEQPAQYVSTQPVQTQFVASTPASVPVAQTQYVTSPVPPTQYVTMSPLPTSQITAAPLSVTV